MKPRDSVVSKISRFAIDEPSAYCYVSGTVGRVEQQRSA
jgi:hypothetical protein